MNIFKKFVGDLFLTNSDDDDVVKVNFSAYNGVQPIDREEGLILYGPTKENKYELVLQEPIERNKNEVYSLLRRTSLSAAQNQFNRLRVNLIPFTTPEALEWVNKKSSLQEVLRLIESNPTWQAAHVCAKLGLAEIIALPCIKSSCDTAELDLHLTPLHIAIFEHHTAVIKALLSLGVSLDAVDVNHNSVFHFAAVTNGQIIELLTSGPSSVLMNRPNLSGQTPLYLACEADLPECVLALFAAGVDLNLAASYDETNSKSINNVESPTGARDVLDKHPNMLHHQDMKMGGTPLHWAKSKAMINALLGLHCQINARNKLGQTALHLMVARNRLDCVVALLSHDAECNLVDSEGNTALHLACSLSVVHALIVFGSDINLKNKKGETARHIIAMSRYCEKAAMIHALHAVGAQRCLALHGCSQGCSSDGLFNGVATAALEEKRERLRNCYDCFLDDAMCGLQKFPLHERGGRLLSLDGGGVRGLVLIILLRAIQRAASHRPLCDLFDWIAGTSTGAILGLAIAMGRSPQYCLRLYFKLKDEIFQGVRPYPEKPLEAILKREFGEDTVMSDITLIKVAVTGVLVDRYPSDLHLFRNYMSGEQLLLERHMNCSSNLPLEASPQSNAVLFKPQPLPQEQKVWQAARASGAAPSYFRAFDRYVDGGLIANNPSMDLLTEVTEYNAVLEAAGCSHEVVKPRILVSLGTGRPPLEKKKPLDIFKPANIKGAIEMAWNVGNLTKLLVDQATMADNHTVDRCRAWCYTAGVRFARFSPLLSADVQLDETRDDVLLSILWETEVYCVERSAKLAQLAAILTALNSV